MDYKQLEKDLFNEPVNSEGWLKKLVEAIKKDLSSTSAEKLPEKKEEKSSNSSEDIYKSLL